jgi:hypothetical protein
VAQWTSRLTMDQKIAGSSPARIDRVLCGKDLDMLVWQADQLKLMSKVLRRNGQCCLAMNQKIAGSSPARINRVLCGKDLDRLVWQADRPQVM